MGESKVYGNYIYNPDTKQWSNRYRSTFTPNPRALNDFYIKNAGENSDGYLTQYINGKRYTVDKRTRKTYSRNNSGAWEYVGRYDPGTDMVQGGDLYDPDLRKGDDLRKKLENYYTTFNHKYIKTNSNQGQGTNTSADMSWEGVQNFMQQQQDRYKQTHIEDLVDPYLILQNPEARIGTQQGGQQGGAANGVKSAGGRKPVPLTSAQRYQNKIAWNNRNGLGTLTTDYGFQLSNSADLDKLAALQKAVGTKVDGYWGTKSQAAWANLTPEQKEKALTDAGIPFQSKLKKQDPTVKTDTETEKQIQPPTRVYHSADQYGSGNFDKNFYNTTIRGKRGVGSVDDLQYYMTVGGPGFKGENTHLGQITRQRLIDEGADPSILDDPTKFAEYARKNWGIKGKMGIFDRKRFIKGTNQYLRQKSIDEYRRSRGYTDGMYYGPGSKGYQAAPVNTGANTMVDQVGQNVSGNVPGNAAANSAAPVTSAPVTSKFGSEAFTNNSIFDPNQLLTDTADKVSKQSNGVPTEQQGGSMQFNPFVSVCRKKLQKPVKAAKGAKLSKDDKATITEAFLQYLQEYKNIDPSTLDPESQKFQDLFDEFITYKQDQLEAQKVAMDRFGTKLNYIKKLSKYRLGGALFMQEGGEMQQPMPQQMPPQQMVSQGPEQPAGPRKLTTEELKQLTDDQIMGRAPIEIGGVVGYLNGDGEWIPQDMLTQNAAFGAKLKHIKRLNEFKCGGKSMKKGGKSKC